MPHRPWNDERLDGLSERVDLGFKHVDAQFRHVEAEFRRVDERFKQVDRRFEQVDRRFDEVDRRFEQVDRRFDDVDRRLRENAVGIARIESRVDQLGGRLDARLDETTKALVVGQQEVNGRLDRLQQSLFLAMTGMIGVVAAAMIGLVATQL